MAVKIFNATETEYTGTTDADLIIGNNLGNFIDGGEGDDVISGGGGEDVILGGEGNDIISGGSGDDVIDAGNGNNIVDGGVGNDFISAGEGNDLLLGGVGDDTIFAGEGDDTINGGAGFDVIQGLGSTAGDENVVGDLYYVTDNDILIGADGNDTFRITGAFDGVTVIDAGVSGLDNTGADARYVEVEADEATGDIYGQDVLNGNASTLINSRVLSEQSETDVRLNIATRPGSTSLSTFATTIAGYNAVDTLEFTKSGDFSESLQFSGIERVELASGVKITLSAEQITTMVNHSTGALLTQACIFMALRAARQKP